MADSLSLTVMKQLLLVEDSTMFGRLAKKKLEALFDLPVYWVKTMEETVRLLEKANNNFHMALLDYNLPDAPNGEVIDEVVKRGISTFIFTSNIDEEVRQDVWSKKVADYILKDDPHCLEYLAAAMMRVENNHEHIVLVVSESPEVRTYFSECLYVQKYRVINAQDGKTALSILQQYDNVKLVLTDNNLPDMDSWVFCQKARELYNLDDLAIIGLVPGGNANSGVRLIKSGANDFLYKDVLIVEEFYCRVAQSIETIELIQETKKNAIKDHLTGLYNRRYFFDFGTKLHASSIRDQISLVCGMIDIDHFKSVNDNYGHDAGDAVLKEVANAMKEKVRGTDIFARIGGEEFCLISVNMTKNGAKIKFEEFRKSIESLKIEYADVTLKVTVSIGVCCDEESSLEALMKKADTLLYSAKKNGRNRVVLQ